jgi:hypothetical protein
MREKERESQSVRKSKNINVKIIGFDFILCYMQNIATHRVKE